MGRRSKPAVEARLVLLGIATEEPIDLTEGVWLAGMKDKMIGDVYRLARVIESVENGDGWFLNELRDVRELLAGRDPAAAPHRCARADAPPLHEFERLVRQGDVARG